MRFDVVIDDPTMLARHELRDVEASDETDAAIKATKTAYEREGFRACAHHDAGDERKLAFAESEDGRRYTIAAPAGEHPSIDYSKPPTVVRLLRTRDPQTGLPRVRVDRA